MFLEQLVSAFVGIAFAFFSWVFVKLFFSPKLIISKSIIKNDNAYKIKIKNTGYRMCSDINLYAKLVVKGLKDYENSFDSFPVDVSFDGFYPVLERGRSIILHLYGTVTSYDKKSYSKELIAKLQDSQNIEELFDLSDDVELKLYVMATDNFSGVRKLYVANSYTKKSILTGVFSANSVDVYKK
jgi:hypothetical protein